MDDTTDDVMERGKDMSFPESVISFFVGDLGQPAGGFPKKLQKIILKNRKPYTNRPNAHLEPIDFDLEFDLIFVVAKPKIKMLMRELLICLFSLKFDIAGTSFCFDFQR